MSFNKPFGLSEGPKKKSIFEIISSKLKKSFGLKVSTLLMASTLAACSGWWKSGSDETPELPRVTPEQAPLTSQSIAEYADFEQSVITKNVSTILRDLGWNPNELTLLIYGDENVSYNPSTDTYTFTLPSTDKTIINNYNAIVTNSDWVTQEVVVSVTNQDLSDDSKTTFNLSDLLVENTTIVEWWSLEFSTNATDEDGFESISYKLYKDWDFYTEWTTDNLVTNSIDWLPVWSYTLEVTVTWNIWWENVIENEVTQSVSIEVVESITPEWSVIPDRDEWDEWWKEFSFDASVYCTDCTGWYFSAEGLPSWKIDNITIDPETWVISWYYDSDPQNDNWEDWANTFNPVIIYNKDGVEYRSPSFTWRFYDQG